MTVDRRAPGARLPLAEPERECLTSVRAARRAADGSAAWEAPVLSRSASTGSTGWPPDGLGPRSELSPAL